ncbi:MAG: apolipoprotein N-acyltransferase, partial [Bacteroidia bacterium]|nr:apolipoprotein N-acyltransferase [Bacteroidia bacterium]
NTDEAAMAETISALHQEEVLITGSLRQTKDGLFANSALILNDVGQIVGFYDKTHLVPFGEYVPFRKFFPFPKLVDLPMDFVAGEKVRTVSIPNAPPAGILICYETIFSGQVVDKKHRPEWLINLVNDGWYGDSAGPYQHLGMAQMRAVEEGLPLVRVAGTGISAVIDPYGRIQKRIPFNRQGILDSSLPRALPPTIYHTYGVGVPIVLSFIFLLAGLLLGRKNK